MHGLIAWFTRNGVAANLLMTTLIVGGIWSLSNRMILQDFPDMPLRTISVSVLYRGSTPGEMEQAIVSRLEEALYDIEGIKQMDSVATANMGTVNLEIEEGFNMSEKLDEVANRVSAIRTFPPEAERPRIHLRRLSEKVITIVLSGDLSEKDMKELGERLRDEVSTLPGITLAAMVADRLYEIAIEIPEATLREYGLTFDQIARAIRTYSVDLSAGSIKTETGRVMLRTNERAYHREDYAAIPLMNRPDGTELTLGEIATVIDGFEETPIVARFNGERALGIDIFRTGDQSFIEIGDT